MSSLDKAWVTQGREGGRECLDEAFVSLVQENVWEANESLTKRTAGWTSRELWMEPRAGEKCIDVIVLLSNIHSRGH